MRCRLFTAVLGLCIAFSSHADTLNTLNGIDHAPLTPDRFGLQLRFENQVAAPVVRTTNSPLRNEFLLRYTNSELPDGKIATPNHPLIEAVYLEQQRDDLLLSVHTREPLQHLLMRNNNELSLTLLASTDTPSAGASEEMARIQSARNEIDDIQFERTDNSTATVRIRTNSDAGTQVQQELKAGENSLSIMLFNTRLPEQHLYLLDVSEFDTPVETIETFREGDHSRIEIVGKTGFEHQLQQLEDNLVLRLFPRPKDELAELSDNTDDRPISLNFQDIPVRQLLQILADENNLNLVASDSVSGTITLRLENVPWNKALTTILRVKGLDKRIDDNILIVGPADELAEREAKDLAASQKIADLTPMQSSYVQVNYAKAAELAALLRNDDTNLLSQRGAVTVDERTNTLLIRDTAEQIEAIRSMVEVLDRPVKQVMIESRMVTVRDNISEELGIRWGFSGSGNESGVSGNLQGAEDMANGNVPALANRLNVNLPVNNPAASLGFHVARLSDGRLLDLELSALEQENRGEIIASPRITTANQKSAYIEQGTEIPFVESSSSGATSVQFKKAVLGLRVTPQITPDNRIILDLVITQNTRGETVSTPTGPAVSIDTQEISTQVLVENGETIVLGGIYQQQILNDISKVPLLGDIPYVGVLFRTTSQINEKRELLIFVTPRVVTTER
ncbi:type IV pilus assembly protein PilQ [Pseudidiomarina planktonica]|uniref:Type IV pilus assembly protein PilQ n=1 Tax=Pseudidiomarina planktonica TaxID=1323738 RepID=A0A1Y6G0X9_9GAMM|nr:type IV pilus secretin PilQ family protein [Pseudidiomarina planktonica]RUO64012.1 type IV pilus secretin PilQ [Pseudidiomarina planktonica]SMQ79894.1 type IV pilus assembly protein PilQ [Pseudidiomarina planktonica]